MQRGGSEAVADHVVTGRTDGNLAAVDRLAASNRQHPDPAVQRRLVELRHAAFDEVADQPGRPSWPPSLPDPFPGEDGVPSLDPGALCGERLGGAILHHGCVRVNGLLSARAEAFRAHIDRAFEGRAQADRGTQAEPGSDAGYVPFEPGQAKARGFGSRGFVRAVDAPAALADLADTFADTGITGAVTNYLGERPAMIANKWILRRSESGDLGTDFHQDGAFLGEGIRTVDCWIALSHCGPGTGAPGIDLIARRVDSILPSSDDSMMPFSITEATVQAALGDARVSSPVFAPGDVLFFDERLPHRTGVGTELGRRYAIESWFVAPSSYPSQHVPIVL